MAKKILIVNFKCYKEATGKNAEKLVRALNKVAAKYKKLKIAIAVQPTDIFRIKKYAKKIDIYAQHIDAIEPGQFTGHISALAVKDAGANGVILNHSEKKITIDEIEDALREAKYNRMKVLICASDDEIGSALSDLYPDYVAVEPPELIGGDISVSKANPEVIKNAVKKILGKHPKEGLIIGAGIKNKEDVKIAVKLGADGILVSSGVVLSKDPAKSLKDLCEGFK